MAGHAHPATPVNVVQTQQDLLCNLLDDMWWDAAVLIPLDEAEQVLPEHLKDHADVLRENHVRELSILREAEPGRLTLPFIPSCVKWSNKETTCRRPAWFGSLETTFCKSLISSSAVSV